MHFLAAFLLLPLFLSAQNANDYTQYVNPFIGTQTDETGALSGSTFPGATMPQGMVQLSPETEQMVTWTPAQATITTRTSSTALPIPTSAVRAAPTLST